MVTFDAFAVAGNRVAEVPGAPNGDMGIPVLVCLESCSEALRPSDIDDLGPVMEVVDAGGVRYRQ